LVLAVEPDLEVVGEAGDGIAAIDMAAELAPDVVLMDVRMPASVVSRRRDGSGVSSR